MRYRDLPTLKKGAWFYKVRGSYLPGTWQGWLTYIPFVAYLIWPIVWCTNHSLTLAESILVIFPQWISATLVMTWVAARKS